MAAQDVSERKDEKDGEEVAVQEPQIITSKQVQAIYDDKSAQRSSQDVSNSGDRSRNSMHRDKSVEEKQMTAAIEYKQDMDKLERIIETRNRSIEAEEKVKHEQNLQDSAFADQSYLAMIN